MSPMCPRLGRTIPHRRRTVHRFRPAMSSGSRASAEISGTRSTDCLTAPGPEADSGRRGPGVAGRPPATSLSGSLRTGPRDTRRGEARARSRGWSAAARRSPTLAASTLRYIAEDRGRKASTVEDYRSIISVAPLPAFGETRLEDMSVAAVEAFQAEHAGREHRGRPITPRTATRQTPDRLALAASGRWRAGITLARGNPYSPCPGVRRGFANGRRRGQ